MAKKIVKKGITYKGHQCDLVQSLYEYPEGEKRVALSLMGTYGVPVATVTVNLPDDDLEKGHVFIKDYSENEGMATYMIGQGIIDKQPVSYAKSGFVTIPCYRLLI